MRNAILLGCAISVSSLAVSVPAAAQQVRYEQDCRDYKQRGLFGIGGIRPPTSDGRVLKQCRQCKIVKKFGVNVKDCEPWPATPNG